MVAARITRPPKAPEIPAEQRFLAENVSWDQYVAIANAFPERPIRVTYDNGWLEIMTVSLLHDRIKLLVDRLIMVLVEVFGVSPFGAFGSFTHRKKKILKAVEPDQCYYTRHFDAVSEKKSIDLEMDPPPDLLVEVEISRSLLERMKILAALRVPEVWRVAEGRLEINVFRDGAFEIAMESPTFPGLDLNEMIRFLPIGLKEGDVPMMRQFEKWARRALRKKRPTRAKRTRNGKA